MAVEKIETVINLWEREDIDIEQVIGKILLLLLAHHQDLLKLQAAVSRLKVAAGQKRAAPH